MRFAVLHHVESDGETGEQLSDAAVYADVLAQVRLADALGFEIAWVAEHHFSAAKGRASSPLLFLTHLAAHTRTIHVGSAVLPAPFYQALRLAEEIAMTDVLTGGRLACGISSSGVPDEMRAFSVSQSGKHARLRESLIFLREAWAGRPVSNPVAPADSPVTIVPRPLADLQQRIWVAASSRGAAEVAGSLGYHLLLPSLRPVTASAVHANVYRAALAASGCPVAGHNVQVTQHLVLHEHHESAIRIAEPIVRAYYDRYTRSGAVERLADESLPSIMARINFLAGGPEAVAGRIRELRDALGLTHVAFQSRLIGLSGQEVQRGLELVMTRVAPLLGSEVASSVR